jgi:hypothetical protein
MCSQPETHVGVCSVWSARYYYFWSDVNKNFNVSTHFSKIPQFPFFFLWKSVHRFSGCYMWTNGRLKYVATLMVAFLQIKVANATEREEGIA